MKKMYFIIMTAVMCIAVCSPAQSVEAPDIMVMEVSGEVNWRVFKLYMAGCAHNFSFGNLNLFQTLLTKSDRGYTPLPATRYHWYA